MNFRRGGLDAVSSRFDLHLFMNIYALESDCDPYWNLRFVNDELDWQQIYRFDGTPLADRWRPLAVKADEQEIRDLPASDFPHLFGAVPVFRKSAATALQPLLEGSGELLPLTCQEGEYFIFNVLQIVDALDEPTSRIIRLPNSEKILEIEHFVFEPTPVIGVDIFKLKQQPLGRVFVSDRFVERVKDARLTGFRFEWLWASDQESSSPIIYATDSQQ